MKHILLGFIILLFICAGFAGFFWLVDFIQRTTGSSIREWIPLIIIIFTISYVLGQIFKLLDNK